MSSPDKPAPVYLDTTAGSRLAGLHAEYASLKPQVDALEERLGAITSAIKAEARTARPHDNTIVIRTPSLIAVVLTHSEPVGLDSKALKAGDPLTWLSYARKGDRWELRQVKP